jgi:hypothetical protein
MPYPTVVAGLQGIAGISEEQMARLKEEAAAKARDEVREAAVGCVLCICMLRHARHAAAPA